MAFIHPPYVLQHKAGSFGDRSVGPYLQKCHSLLIYGIFLGLRTHTKIRALALRLCEGGATSGPVNPSHAEALFDELLA